MFRKPILTAAALALAASGATLAWASSDWVDQPEYTLRKVHYDPYGASAFVAPSNDTRVNLALLLDRSAPAARPMRLPLFSWDELSGELAGRRDANEEGFVPATRCQSNAGGSAAFAAALAANRAVPAAEREALLAARANYRPDCDQSAAPSFALAGVTSAQGRQFAAYLGGAASFYAGDFAGAATVFGGLGGARDPWLKEAALYMVARSELNRAQQTAFNEWGEIDSPPRTDAAALASATSAFDAYLKAYPQGRYAASARGLKRRLYWLGGDHARLAASYGEALASGGASAGAPLAEEIDNRLLFTSARDSFTNPLLIAVSDLARMRREQGEASLEADLPKRITRAEIEAQRRHFAGQTELFDFLLASEALHVRGAHAEVLALIPDAARQPRFSSLQFSRQMLRGLALEAAKDRNARGFWLEMLGGAKQLWQREAVELALAAHDEKSGGIDRVFARDSQVRNPTIREILLEFSAGPALLRQQARDRAASQREREVALYILLAKQLGHGLYADFLTDLRLVPAGAPADGGLAGAHEASQYVDLTQEKVPLGQFTGGSLGDFGCPALRDAAAALAGNPRANKPLLCVADFWRTNGLDHFVFDKPLAASGLGSGPSQFPGRAFQRQAIYQAVMASPSATADEKAYALYRAVRCYAPNGSNDCGGTDAPEAQRRAWFQRLKREFPQSRWARQLNHYW